MSNQYKIIAFYKFVEILNYEEFKEPIKAAMVERGIKGTILLAREGVNATIAGSSAEVDDFWEFLSNFDERLDGGYNFKTSYSEFQPFERTKVRLKKEIVRMGLENLPVKSGEYLKGEDWDNMIMKPETITIDTRNDYEVMMGSFEGAVNPETKDFRSFPKWADDHLKDTPKDTPIAMFCTGGIRCEKSTSYLKHKGFKNVYHLDGGILQYLEDKRDEGKEHLWNGDCFVFDDRVAVNESLEPSPAPLCKDCGQPVTGDDIRWGDVELRKERHNQKGMVCLQCAPELYLKKESS